MAKTKLCFDATTDVDNVGAWVRAGTDGDRIGSQNVASEEWLNVASLLVDETGTPIDASNPLDVNITNTLGIDVDLDHTEDSVRLGDGTSFFTSTSENGDIALDVHLSNTEIAVTQGSDSPWAIEATDLDIRDLTAVSDSIASHTFDGSGTAITSTLVGADQGLDVNVINAVEIDDTANTACAFSATSVDDTAGGTDLVGTDLANRKYLKLYNNGNQTVYIGESGVTAATGFPLDPCSYLDMRAGANCNLHAIGATAAAQDIRIMELS